MLNGKRHWLDDPRNVTKLYRTVWAIGIALALAEFVVRRHEELGFAGWFAFYAVFGFVACVALVLAAKEVLRRMVKRPEDYYER
jgi:uncharacterized membrane protein YhaH (DUF805 family)